jgi:hypothetical protein
MWNKLETAFSPDAALATTTSSRLAPHVPSVGVPIAMTPLAPAPTVSQPPFGADQLAPLLVLKPWDTVPLPEAITTSRRLVPQETAAGS